jgi:hypothetical protein
MPPVSFALESRAITTSERAIHRIGLDQLALLFGRRSF